MHDVMKITSPQRKFQPIPHESVVHHDIVLLHIQYDPSLKP
jgi:hypothetical protein